jgi:ubiquinone/menaquinone biosynthesis C-methylase UbiE
MILFKSIDTFLFMSKTKSIKQNTKQKFTSRSDNQEFYYNSVSGIFLGSLVREAEVEKVLRKIKRNESFLEVGCAQGFYLEKARKKTKKVFGIDINTDFIEKAKMTGANTKVASAEKLPYKAKFFDWVLCTETLEHVPNWKKAVKEISRVLKPKGKAIITIPLELSGFWTLFSFLYPPEETRGHINLLTAKDIEKEFLKNKMKLKKRKYLQTMSKTINSFLPQKEGISMYCFFIFEKYD